MTLLDRLKTRLAISGSDEDARLGEIIISAKSFIVSYCHIPEYDDRCDEVCLRIAAEDYGKLDGSGVSYRNFSGVYESYRSGYSDTVMSALNSMRRIQAR